MPISLTNRVMVCAGISNIGAENYWKAVYSSLDLKMGHETTAFFAPKIKPVATRNITDH